MDVSVLIPTRRRPARLAACVAGLAGQSLGAQRYEVVVGLDGVDPQSRGAAERACRDAGGVPSMPLTYGYDDLELAFRLAQRFSLPVLYRPEARAPHRHRYRAIDLLRREQALGVAACRYARLHPAFAVVLFGRDILDPGEVASCRNRVEREQEAMADLEASFLGLDETAAIDDPQEIARTYRKHLPLKRHCWRRGLLREVARTSEVTHAAS